MHCSRACAAQGLDDVDARLEAAIVSLLAARARGASICPSEACRVVFGDVFGDHAHRGEHEPMERTRRAARRLVARGQIEITQRGVVVDPSRAKGPIRLRAVDRPAEPVRVPRRRRGESGT